LVLADRTTMKVMLPIVAALVIAAVAVVAAPKVASADFSVDPTPNGLTITTYTGTLAEFEADGEALNLVSAFATVDGSFMGHVFGAPDFVNADFNAEFAGGLNNQGLIVRAGDAPAMTPTPTATATSTGTVPPGPTSITS
jgi:hypothetical protein